MPLPLLPSGRFLGNLRGAVSLFQRLEGESLLLSELGCCSVAQLCLTLSQPTRLLCRWSSLARVLE